MVSSPGAVIVEVYTVLVRYTEVKYQQVFFKNMNTKFDELLSEINRVLQKEMLKLTISAWKFKHA